MNLQTKVMLTVSEIVELYLDQETEGQPWALAWSGGKDSTTVLALVCRALQMIPAVKRTRDIRVVMSDTKMENPILEEYMHRQVDAVNDWAYSAGMPIEVRVVSREDSKSFFVGIIGKGWTLPNNGDDRYCTHHLKIDPQNKAVEDINPCLLLIGTRTDESARRSGTIEKYRDGKGSRFSTSPYNKGRRIYMPIVEFTTDEIWQVLLNPLPWGSSEEIRKLYKDATGECALINPNGAQKTAKFCGARFGCWVCPPITKDKSTENMAKIYDWMKPLTEWRQLLKDVHNPKKNPQFRSGYRRNRTPMGYGKGCLAISARRYLLETLIQTQEDVNRLRVMDSNPLHRAPIELINSYEIGLIRKHWEEDAKERPWLIDNQEMEPGDFRKAEILIAEKMDRKREKRREAAASGIVMELPLITI
ncbi:phosphoadenosine phosphosulfate reductase family protein [Paenibacillus sp. GYB004]|uniref:phosphoadenosine phosphosulfate reductase domain-containing protein n=1 Tax=Paenibacillus sp. GYB004 TaxID=2994393 RepID=UPI002F9614A5